MATLINAHVPLSRALGVTLEQITSVELKRVVEQVKYDVDHGSPLNDALAQHPKVFSELYINMVKAGEVGVFSASCWNVSLSLLRDTAS